MPHINRPTTYSESSLHLRRQVLAWQRGCSRVWESCNCTSLHVSVCVSVSVSLCETECCIKSVCESCIASESVWEKVCKSYCIINGQWNNHTLDKPWSVIASPWSTVLSSWVKFHSSVWSDFPLVRMYFRLHQAILTIMGAWVSEWAIVVSYFCGNRLIRRERERERENLHEQKQMFNFLLREGQWGGLIVKEFTRQSEDLGSGTICGAYFWCSRKNHTHSRTHSLRSSSFVVLILAEVWVSSVWQQNPLITGPRSQIGLSAPRHGCPGMPELSTVHLVPLLSWVRLLPSQAHKYQ